MSVDLGLHTLELAQAIKPRRGLPHDIDDLIMEMNLDEEKMPAITWC